MFPAFAFAARGRTNPKISPNHFAQKSKKKLRIQRHVSVVN
jgi:hypothetical protein